MTTDPTATVTFAPGPPRQHIVLATDNDPGHDVPLPKGVEQKAKMKSPAEWAYQRLILYIQKFEEGLDGSHEVAMGFAGSDSGTIRIEGIGFFEPDIITFFGSDEMGAKTQLVQHVSQLNVMLRALPKRKEDDTARRIGFRLAADLETDET